MQHMYACKNIKLIYFLFYFSRLADWLIAIGQNDILLKPNYYTYTYNNGRLCEKHFFDWCFTSTERKTLIKFARPQTECNPNAKGINKHLTAIIGTEVSSSDDSERSHNDVLMNHEVNENKPAIKVRTPKTKKIIALKSANTKLKQKILFQKEKTS